MSSGDRLLLILHVGFAIFALGPITAATMATPRYIRRADASVVRYLNRATRIYGLLTLGIFLFGLLLAHGKFNQVWLTASMTLFIVAFVLLLLIERDQRKALHKIELSDAERGAAAPAETPPPVQTPPPAQTAPADKPVAGTETKVDTGDAAKAETPAPEPKKAPAPADEELAKVETGRIAMISGVVALIWIVILVLMVWNG